MKKFHINNKGEVKPCNATIKACLYLTGEHFDTLEEGHKYVENNYGRRVGTFKKLKKSTTNKPIENLVLLHHTLWRNRKNLSEDEVNKVLDTFINDNSYYGLLEKRSELFKYFTNANNSEWTASIIRKNLNDIIGV